jgi:hypothetical protein
VKHGENRVEWEIPSLDLLKTGIWSVEQDLYDRDFFRNRKDASEANLDPAHETVPDVSEKKSTPNERTDVQNVQVNELYVSNANGSSTQVEEHF